MYFEASLQALRPDETHITSLRNVISIKHKTTVVLVAFWLVLPFRVGKNFKGFRYYTKLYSL